MKQAHGQDLGPAPGRRMAVRSWALTLAAASVGLVVTLLVAVLPFLKFAYRGPSLHVALETTAALIALLAAFLVFGRYRQRARLDDLALVAALALLGVTNLVFAAVPNALASGGSNAVWAQVAGAFAGASLLAFASLGHGPRLARPRRAAAAMLAACGLAILLLALVGFTDLYDLPRALPPDALPPEPSEATLVGHPLLLGSQLASVLLFATAAVGFTRRGARGDVFLRWFGVATAFAAVARLNYFLFPSLYSDWIYTGDLFRLAYYLVILGAAAQEIRAYWHDLAETAVLEERRRMARDLHDGLAQELAFIAAETRGDRPALLHVATAAERALDESRRAIAALTRPVDEPLARALAQVGEEVGLRVGTRVECVVDDGIEVTPETREALVRVVREAVTNAARHGRATGVSISIRSDAGLRMRIVDDGVGFDAAVVRRGGFGLASMRERIRQLGGELRLRSAVGAGTEIEVMLP